MNTAFKLVLLGESAVGKSSVVARFMSGNFSSEEPPTIGAAFYRTKIDLPDDKSIDFELWDTAGQEQYSCLTPVYYRDADAALVVYDITKWDSFERAKRWVRELREQLSHDVVLCIIGNKLDLETSRVVSRHEADIFAEENECLFMEGSALSGLNIKETFIEISNNLPDRPIVNCKDLLSNTVNLTGNSSGGCSC
ncbi:hypothetical protein GEMRC1_004461 [Eukaryota sp. GEM-RC1]